MRSAPTPALARLEAAYTASSSGTLPGPGRALLESAELQGDEYGCSEERHDRRDLLEPKPRGVNLGGWLVLEPWVTPSLFYQFEGRPANETAMDMHGFCRVLGAQEANRQLRIHWEKWVTEEHLAELASRGINALRVPVGDWMWTPYWPYHGCADGAVDQLKRVLRHSQKLGLRVLIDLHGVRRSQNGFDNSGQAVNVTWLPDGQSFAHWPCRSAGWQGTFDPLTMTYSSISWDNIRTSVYVLQHIASTLRHYPAVLGVEALNEPWQFTPLDVLKAFYWDSYWAVRAAAPRWLFVIQDSFRLDAWGDYMAGCGGVALDTHVYQAWFDIRPQNGFLDNACSWRQRLQKVQATGLPVLIGEWSLATDNCNMWLNGFHDNAPGYPKVDCGDMECPQPYVPGIAGPPTGAAPGPRGSTGNSAPSFGRCPVAKPWPNEDAWQSELMEHKLSAFDEAAAGWFYWNFRVELEPRWSWLEGQSRGWMPPNISALPPRTLAVCPANTSGDKDAPPPGADLPWYNALPSSARSSSLVLVLVVGTATLIGTAVALKLALLALGRGRSARSSALQLPPRLLRLARKTAGRKPGGIGLLGLRHRVSSRSLAQLAFPLMSARHAIREELDEESEASWDIGATDDIAAPPPLAPLDEAAPSTFSFTTAYRFWRG